MVDHPLPTTRSRTWRTNALLQLLVIIAWLSPIGVIVVRTW